MKKKIVLGEFLVEHRELIERRTREVFFARSVPNPPESELQRGIPIFMEELIDALRREETDDEEIAKTAYDYGQRLFRLGFTVSELVHAYGSVCSVVTRLARELNVDIATGDFETFNRTLDVAIAEAVTAHESERTVENAQQESLRIGVLTHELRNTLSAATMALQVIKSGTVGMGGPTADVLDRSLASMTALIDRSLAEVRLRTDPAPVLERFRLADAMDQICATVHWEVEIRHLKFTVEMDRELELETDRQFLTSIVANLVQNAVKYTCAGGHVSLRGYRAKDSLLIEVEDECGGLPPGKVDGLFRPFVRGTRRSPGVGLGLSIAMGAVKALNGDIRVRNLPERGCIFSVELPYPSPRRLETAL